MTPTRCRFCGSNRCFTRIHTGDGRFDEVACRDHAGMLERLADGTLNGAARIHTTSSDRLSRGTNREGRHECAADE